MGVIGGPNIIEHKTEGNPYRLEIVYDAASVRSYPGSGTLWKNLGKLSRDKDGTLTNGPTFSDERSFLDSFGYFHLMELMIMFYLILLLWVMGL